MSETQCPVCASYSEQYWQLSGELARAEDEVTMTRKNAPEFAVKKAKVKRLQGLVKDIWLRKNSHEALHRRSS